MQSQPGVLLHIPHASLHLPPDKLGPLFVPYVRVEGEALAKADLFCDELFQHPGVVTVAARYSRMVCDVERFPDDADEVMAQCGQGLFYTHFDDGTQFRDDTLRAAMKRDVYDAHHRIFTDAVSRALDTCGRCLIIDCHSFLLPGEQPDLCIGTDDYHTPPALGDCADEFARGHGYCVRRNDPYAGAIVPAEFYQKDARVSSIMIELNRHLYLTDAYKKSENYLAVQAFCRELIGRLAVC